MYDTVGTRVTGDDKINININNNNKVFSRHAQHNSSKMEYENEIPKSDMSSKPR